MYRERPTSVTVLGGGPAGLGAAFYARKNGLPVQLYEANDRVGGNSRTLSMGPFRFDTGAHRLHDKVPEVTADIQDLLGEDLRRIQVPSQIYWKGQLIDFPLTPLDLLTKLETGPLLRMVGENLQRLVTSGRSPRHFREMAVQAYGPTLADMFLLNYSSKLWGKPTRELSTAIAGGRLEGLDLKTFLLEALRGRKAKTRHLDGSFYYPRHGFGTIFDAVADYVGRRRIHCSTPVTRLRHEGRRITEIVLDEERSIEPDRVVGTLPLTIMMQLLDPAPPDELLRLSRSIEFRHLRLVVLGLNTSRLSPNASLYFPAHRFPFTRIYEPKNRSSEMAPAGKTAAVVEMPAFSTDPWWQEEEDRLTAEVSSALERIGLIDSDEIVRAATYRVAYAYPVLDTSFRGKVEHLLAYLRSYENLDLIGRSAQFEYTHTHDLFAAARETMQKMSR